VRIKDFGFCRLKDNVLKTQKDGVEYLAPELLATTLQASIIDFKYDEKVDIYAFAIILCQLFTRENIFAELSPKQVSNKLRAVH
jgi:serine/threonine protein kinase